MDQMDIITKVVPFILVVLIVYWNMRRIKKNLEGAKREQQMNSCNGSCQGCAHSAGCTSAKKQDQEEAEK